MEVNLIIGPALYTNVSSVLKLGETTRENDVVTRHSHCEN